MNRNRTITRSSGDTVDWCELESALAALRHSAESSLKSDEPQSFASDEEDPELLNLLSDSSNEELNSDENKQQPKRQTTSCEGDGQPEESQQGSDFVVERSGAFEEECLDSSNRYFCFSSGEEADKGTCFSLLTDLGRLGGSVIFSVVACDQRSHEFDAARSPCASVAH